MVESPLEHLPGIVAAGGRQAAQILEQLKGQNKVSVRTRELVNPSNGKAGLNVSGAPADETLQTVPNRLIYGENIGLRPPPPVFDSGTGRTHMTPRIGERR